MYRFCLEKLKRWALNTQSKPLVLRGARQVGKTTLVRQLADALTLTLVEVNMEDDHYFTSMLTQKSKAKDILELLLLERNISRPAQEILFFFDEAQEQPGLYAYLRYFKELAPEYKIIAAGSLFEFELTSQKTSQGPTGRIEYAYLEPMSFLEFLHAYNRSAYAKLLTLDTKDSVPEPLHELYTRCFKEYLLCGGMPEVVKAFIDGLGPLRVDEIKSDILTGYISDLPRYAALNKTDFDVELLSSLLMQIVMLPANSKKYSELLPGVKAEKVKKHLNALLKAKVIRRSIHTSEVKIPLGSGGNDKYYKYFSLDVGLSYTSLGFPVTQIYTTSDINDVANGVLAEQYVAQTIAALPPFHKSASLYHWQRLQKNATAEVDFMLALGGDVFPLECKSGLSSKMKSLRILCKEKQCKQAIRVWSGNISHEDMHITLENGAVHTTHLVSLPHYMLERFCYEHGAVN